MTTKKPRRVTVSDALLVGGFAAIVTALWMVAAPLGVGGLGVALVVLAIGLYRPGA